MTTLGKVKRKQGSFNGNIGKERLIGNGSCSDNIGEG